MDNIKSAFQAFMRSEGKDDPVMLNEIADLLDEQAETVRTEILRVSKGELEKKASIATLSPLHMLMTFGAGNAPKY